VAGLMAAIINHLLWDEDFSSYADEAALSAAYPALDGTGRYVDELSIDFGATLGPDGQPGIRDQAVSPARDTGAISRGDLAPTCYGFRLKARWNFATTNAELSAHEVTTLQWQSEDATYGIVNLSRAHATATLRLSIQTIAPYGNLSGNTVDYHEFPGVVPTNVPVTVEVNGRRSTLTQVSSGVYAPDTDGEVHLLIDGVEIYAFSGPVWNGEASFNPTPYWNYANFQTLGALSDIEVWDETGCAVVPPDGSNICDCVPPTGSPVNPPVSPPPIVNPPPIEMLIGEQLACLGGGLVPIQADFVPVETWWGL
jgi:hypothetical protein